jgi:hypothetical protein
MTDTKRWWRHAAVAVVVAGALLGAACSGGDGDSANANSGNTSVGENNAQSPICDAVAKADVEAIFNDKFIDPSADTEDRCLWRSLTSSSGPQVSISKVEGTLAQVRDQVGVNGGQTVDVAGLGDGAFWVTGAGLVVDKAGVVYSFAVEQQVNPPSDDDAQRLTTQLAAKALPNL